MFHAKMQCFMQGCRDGSVDGMPVISLAGRTLAMHHALCGHEAYELLFISREPLYTYIGWGK